MVRPLGNVAVMSRVVGATVGFVFAAVGVAVIGFLWFGIDQGFGGPPIFFRIVGSLIAIVFVVVGGSAGLAAVAAGPRFFPDPAAAASGSAVPLATGSFTCTHCGAAMAGQAEASPHGDVKCAHCGAWFNIHGRS